MVAETRTLTAQVPVELAEEVDALSAQIERPSQRIIKKALVQYLARGRKAPPDSGGARRRNGRSPRPDGAGPRVGEQPRHG
jgi:predicted transcriptional regulator